MTAGQKALAKAIRDLEWAADVFDESATPEVVDVPTLLATITSAVEQRKAEALARLEQTRKE